MDLYSMAMSPSVLEHVPIFGYKIFRVWPIFRPKMSCFSKGLWFLSQRLVFGNQVCVLGILTATGDHCFQVFLVGKDRKYM